MFKRFTKPCRAKLALLLAGGLLAGSVWPAVSACFGGRAAQTAAPGSVFADEAVSLTEYENYIYDSKGNPHPAPAAFTWSESLTRDRIGQSLAGLSDIAVSENAIYLSVADGILKLDRNFRFLEKRQEYRDGDGGETKKLHNPAGIFINKKEELYVTLPDAGCVVKFAADGKSEKVYKQPEGLDLKGAKYLPTAVAADRIGRLFVIGQGIYEGIIEMAPDGSFTRFFGVNHVRFNPVELFWRMIATEKQRKQMALWLPTDYSDIAMQQDGFLFATAASVNAAGKLQLLNSKGIDILRFPNGRRPEGDRRLRPGYDSRLISVTAREDGLFAVLDSTMKRVFVYDENGYMLCNFGSAGSLRGTLNNPLQIAFLGERILVADQLTQSLELFEPTEYGKLLLAGAKAEHEQDNAASQSIWQNVLTKSPYLPLAYISLGNSAYREHKYQMAKEYYRRADDRVGYSKAFAKIRDAWLSRYFNQIALFFLLLVLLLIARSVYKRRRRRGLEESLLFERRALAGAGAGTSDASPALLREGEKRHVLREYALRAARKRESREQERLHSLLRYPGYVMTRPFKAFADLKYEGAGSFGFCVFLLLFRAVLAILSYGKTGFLLNGNDPQQINTILIVLAAVVPYILFSVSNWSSTTLMNGSGKLKEIFMVLMYAQLPFLLMDVLSLFLSNVVTLEEVPLLLMLQSFSVVYSVVLGFIGLVSIHEFSFSRGVASVVVSVVAAMIILFILLLLTSLAGEFIHFLRTVVQEIMLNRF